MSESVFKMLNMFNEKLKKLQNEILCDKNQNL